jgi:hypothetical protein
MKRILMTTAFVVATAGMASAQEMSQLRQLVEQDLATSEYDNVDVSALTDEQVTRLYFIATSTDSSSVRQELYDQVLDKEDADMERSSRVRAFRPMAGDEDMEEVQTTMPRNQLRSLVQQLLETYQYEVDVMSLDDSTLAGIFLVDTSTDSASEEKERIEAILRDGGYM